MHELPRVLGGRNQAQSEEDHPIRRRVADTGHGAFAQDLFENQLQDSDTRSVRRASGLVLADHSGFNGGLGFRFDTSEIARLTGMIFGNKAVRQLAKEQLCVNRGRQPCLGRLEMCKSRRNGTSIRGPRHAKPIV